MLDGYLACPSHVPIIGFALLSTSERAVIKTNNRLTIVSIAFSFDILFCLVLAGLPFLDKRGPLNHLEQVQFRLGQVRHKQTESIVLTTPCLNLLSSGSSGF